jgi:5-methylcytosine-specific restriction endonuclease McrA
MTVMVSSKLCSKCGVEKSFSDFHKNKARRDGIETYCKECNNARLRKAYVNNSSEKIKKTRAYHLNNPEWSKSYQHDWHQQNKERIYIKVKKRLSTDAEFLQYRRELVARKERERRAQKANTQVVKVTKEDYEKLLTVFESKCWICELPLSKVFWDHVQPLSKGGAHSKENLKPVCNPCNVRKNALWPFTDEMKQRIANEVRSLPSLEEVMP